MEETEAVLNSHNVQMLVKSNISQDNEVQSEMTFANYIEALEKEENNWKKTRQESKKDYADKVKESYVTEKLSWENCQDLLTDEDKQFLREQPNYKEIMENYRKLLKTTVECMRMKQKVDHVLASLISSADTLLEDTCKTICNLD